MNQLNCLEGFKNIFEEDFSFQSKQKTSGLLIPAPPFSLHQG